MKFPFKSQLGYFVIYLLSLCLIATYLALPFHLHELGITNSKPSFKVNHSMSPEDCKVCLQVRSISNSILVSKFYYLKTSIETFLLIIFFVPGSISSLEFFSARAPPQI